MRKPRKLNPAALALKSGFARRLRAAREARGWSQEELALAAGLSVATIRNLEQFHRPDPRLSTMLSLADALGATLDALAGREKFSEIPATNP